MPLRRRHRHRLHRHEKDATTTSSSTSSSSSSPPSPPLSPSPPTPSPDQQHLPLDKAVHSLLSSLLGTVGRRGRRHHHTYKKTSRPGIHDSLGLVAASAIATSVDVAAAAASSLEDTPVPAPAETQAMPDEQASSSSPLMMEAGHDEVHPSSSSASAVIEHQPDAVVSTAVHHGDQEAVSSVTPSAQPLIITPPASPTDDDKKRAASSPFAPPSSTSEERKHQTLSPASRVPIPTSPTRSPNRSARSPSRAPGRLGEKFRPAYSSLFPTFDGLFEDEDEDVLAGVGLDQGGGGLGGSVKFLDEYTREALVESFWSMAEGLEKAGYSNLVFQIDVSDPFVHRSTLSDTKLLPPLSTLPTTTPQTACLIQITSEDASNVTPHPRFEVKDDNFLMDVFVRRKRLIVHDLKGYQDLLTTLTSNTQRGFLSPSHARIIKPFLEAHLMPGLNGTVIEWTCMQNPLGVFREDRPACPGQRFPGLGVAREFQRGVVGLAKVRGRDFVGTVPDHFHNAWLYWGCGYRFVNPAFQGWFEAVLDDLNPDIQKHGIAAVSWAFHNGHIKTSNNLIEVWNPQDQIIPISKRMMEYFEGREYREMVEMFRGVFLGRVRVGWEDAGEVLRYSVAGRCEEMEGGGGGV
ncbi:hypothetical protein HDU67_008518 [Dinochytrium kinnereticum]|nr:hypothetical protein HDU67_008518 [Dinochytrium kinnereticum]